MLGGGAGDRAASARSVQLIMYVVGFLDLAGVMMVIPMFVTHLRHLGLSPLMNGAIRSFYGVLQLVFSPLVGRWSDRYGRRPLLVMCLGVSALSYLVLGSSASIWVVIGSRIVTGIFKHSTTLCKSVLADVTPPEDRPKVMGKFNGAMGIAIILSPAIGGHLAHLDNGFAIVCSVSGVIFLGNCVVCLGLLPHELPLHARQTEDDQSKKDIAAKPRNEWLSLLYEVEWKVFGDIFVVDFFLTFAAYAYRASFVLIIDQMFAVSPTTIGYIISFQGAIGAAAGFFAGRLSRFQGSSQMVLFNSALVQAASLLGLTFAPSILLIVMLLVPLSVSATLIHTATSTLIIDRCAPSKIGSVTGVAQGIPAIAGMTTPVLAGLAQEAGVRGPGVLASMAAFVGAAAAGWAAHYRHTTRQTGT
ncbi:major facilitator superfamily domain-containing protein 9-like [Scylla paramamosain]|uniref:major facilitator superfamily domain-containing protein 9-like n=1 Tax=Scylla paramamosain TaxID=85552 RepID=UPI003083B3C0